MENDKTKSAEKKETSEKVETPKTTLKEDKKKSESAVQKAKQAMTEAKEKKTKDAEPKDKVILEREYVVPLRKGFLKVPRYKRAKKAIKTLREFLVKHMKVEERDLRKIKIDRYLNEEIWFRGIKKPSIKIKVKAKKMSSGIVLVELAEVPQAVKYKMAKDAKYHKPVNVESPKHAAPETGVTEAEKEKEDSVAEAAQKVTKTEVKQAKHTTAAKQKPQKTPQRKVMKR